MNRILRRRAAVAVLALAALAGCTAGSDADAEPSASATPPAAAVDPNAPCKDGKPAAASIAPGDITTQSRSWPADSRMRKIVDRKRLIVGVSGDAVLWGYSDPKDGSLAGYDVDVAKEVAAALGVGIEYRVLPLSARLTALTGADDAVDLVAERLSMTCARWEGTSTAPAINFSSQYYQAGQKLLVRKNLSEVTKLQDLTAEQPVCAVAGSTSLATAQRQEGVKAPIDVAADSGQCLVKFQEGEVVGITADDTTLAGFSDQDPNARVVGNAFTTERYGLGMSREDGAFTQFVNAVLRDLRDAGTLRQLYQKWMAPNVEGGRFVLPDAVLDRTQASIDDVRS